MDGSRVYVFQSTSKLRQPLAAFDSDGVWAAGALAVSNAFDFLKEIKFASIRTAKASNERNSTKGTITNGKRRHPAELITSSKRCEALPLPGNRLVETIDY